MNGARPHSQPEGAEAKSVRRFILSPHGLCVTCSQYVAGEMMPWHDASPRCESGKRNHCTCDICF
jgi:hypothetical protein